MLATKRDILAFLTELKMALAGDGVGGGLMLIDRDKNLATLSNLGISWAEIPSVLKKLGVWDYSAGPLVDDKGRDGEWWVFAPDYGGSQLYVKVQVPRPRVAICLSFHEAERPLNRPYHP